jgi:pimeloyl-ACP methyl ester carboxylesterase
MPFARNGPVQIHYEVEGSGPALLLHTGAGGDLRIWREAGYVEGLAGFRVILMDQRGRGKSSRPGELTDHRIERFVDDISAVLDDAGVASAGFWGYSNGTVVGIAFGAAHPDRLKALVGTGSLSPRNFDDPPPDPDPDRRVDELTASGGVVPELERRMEVENDRFPSAIDRNVRDGDPRMCALDLVAWRSWHGPRSAFATFPAPVLMISGENEGDEGRTERSMAELPDGRVVRLPGLGHLGSFYRSDVALPHALPFLHRALG